MSIEQYAFKPAQGAAGHNCAQVVRVGSVAVAKARCASTTAICAAHWCWSAIQHLRMLSVAGAQLRTMPPDKQATPQRLPAPAPAYLGDPNKLPTNCLRARCGHTPKFSPPHRLHSCCSLLPVPLQAGQLRGRVSKPVPSAVLLLPSGLQWRTMISPLPLHTLHTAVCVEASKPDPCKNIPNTRQHQLRLFASGYRLCRTGVKADAGVMVLRVCGRAFALCWVADWSCAANCRHLHQPPGDC